MGVSTVELVIAVVVSLGAAVIQGSIGMGFNIVSVPILALVDPRLAPVPQLIVSFPLSIAAIVRERADVDMRSAGWIVAGRLPGAMIGLGLLAVATQRVLDLMLAAFVLVAVAVLWGGWQVRRSRGLDFAAGIASGITGLVASMGGPPLALLLSKERGPRLRSTLALVFTIGLAISILARTLGGKITLTEVRIGLTLIAPAALGFLLSNRLLARVEGTVVRVGVLVLSSVAAAALLLRAIVG